MLFTDDLYTRISRNAIETADRLKEGLAAKGYRFYMESPTNQVFPILENSQLEALEPLAKFGFWEKYDDTHTRDAHCHQLGHPHGGDRAADRPDVMPPKIFGGFMRDTNCNFFHNVVSFG